MSLSRLASARLAELGDRYGLRPEGRRALEAILNLQEKDPTASTAVREPAEAVERHVADSLVALEIPAVREARAVADLGSGAGWPGFALAAALPEARVSLVESANRRCRYLERAVEVSGLTNVSVVDARAEDWPAGIGEHDVVTARALAALPVVLEYAAPLLAPDGVVVAWKGAVLADETADAAAAAAALGLTSEGVRDVLPFREARDRTLHVFRKTAPTPERYPRRPGMATKRPLSAKP